ncbi:MAG: hypothetical protein HOI33_05730 [Rhodospirillaceae bacterium]|nr:hypothetical protein [Rhodospirillaceae bacterium]
MAVTGSRISQSAGFPEILAYKVVVSSDLEIYMKEVEKKPALLASAPNCDWTSGVV